MLCSEDRVCIRIELSRKRLTRAFLIVQIRNDEADQGGHWGRRARSIEGVTQGGGWTGILVLWDGGGGKHKRGGTWETEVCGL